MSQRLIIELEAAIAAKNPALAQRLQPGLPDDAVKQYLSEAQVTGEVDALIALYTWKNGTVADESTLLTETAFFPDELYQFLPIQTAISQLKDMHSGATFHPKLAQEIARYFPMFWDNSTGFIAVDVTNGSNNRVVLLDFEEAERAREAFSSFDDFIRDAIRANVEDDRLACFQPGEHPGEDGRPH